MTDCTPTTDEVRRSYRSPVATESGRRDGELFAEFLSRRSIESFQQEVVDGEAFDRWLAEVKRAAASPSVVIALLERLERAEVALERAKAYPSNGGDNDG